MGYKSNILTLVKVKDGQGFKEIIHYYYKSEKPPAKPPAGTADPTTLGWSKSMPEYDGNKNYSVYTTEKIVYADNSFYYTEVIKSTEYENLKNLQLDINSLSYFLETSQEEFLKFIKEVDEPNGQKEEEIIITPKILKIRAYQINKEGKKSINLDDKMPELAFVSSSGASYNIYEETNPKNPYILYVPYTPRATTGQVEYSTNKQEWHSTFNPAVDKWSRISLDGTVWQDIQENERDKTTLEFNIGFFFDPTIILTEEEKLIQKALRDESGFFYIYIFDRIGKKQMAAKVIGFRYGYSSEMARLEIHAGDINAAIQSTNLNFSAEGLKLKNGSIRIYKDNYEEQNKVFGADEKGDLFFKGHLYGASGDFTGHVNAQTGTLGELSIGEVLDIKKKLWLDARATVSPDETYYILNKDVYEEVPEVTDLTKEYYIKDKEGNYRRIKLTDLVGIYSQTYKKDSTKGFYLDPEGTIHANDIILGTGAVIADYIKLGQATILNPTGKNNKVFITCKDETGRQTLKIKDNGIINLGIDDNIVLDGVSGSIYSKNNWSITPELATFNNAHIIGKLSTCIFEKQKTRLSGGSIIFKNASRIMSVAAQDTIVIEDDPSLYTDVGEFITVKINGIPSHRKVKAIVPAEKKIVLSSPLEGAPADINLKADEENLAIYLGDGNVDESGNTVITDWCIGVNSETEKGLLGMEPNSITFSSMKYDEKTQQLVSKPEIILGKLPFDITKHNGTSGLYASSVYLSGSLTNRYQEGLDTKYAGINTESHVKFNKTNRNLDPDTSNIIFWTGADDTDEVSIQNAKFQVTSNGTVYANQGFFEGSIIAGAQIQASVLKATDVYPDFDTDKQNGLLRLHNTNSGITFYEDQPDGETLRGLSLNSNGITFDFDFVHKQGQKKILNIDLSETGENSGSSLINTTNAQFDRKLIVGENTDCYFEFGASQNLPGNRSDGYIRYKALRNNEIKTLYDLDINELGFSLAKENLEKLLIHDSKKDIVTLNSVETHINSEITIDEKKFIKRVRNTEDVIIGYDIFVE